MLLAVFCTMKGAFSEIHSFINKYTKKHIR